MITILKNGRRIAKVSCKICNCNYLKRMDSIKEWNGKCNPCSQKETANRPDVKERASKRARIQVLKQGGIPNAKKFDGTRCGDKHHNWQGGITPIYMKIRNSKESERWRKAVYIRDNYTCQECGNKGVRLHADHIKPFAFYPELRFELSNGRTLCIPCHIKTDTYGGRAFRFRENVLTKTV